MKKNTRLVIHTRDVACIIGASERTACRLLIRIRIANGKPRLAPVTVEEFCRYTCLEIKVVMEYL